MEKTSVAQIIIILGLLVLCMVTLVVVYSAGRGSSVLLLEETFQGLDDAKWKHEVAACTEGGEQFHYVTADEENGLIADGVLHIYPNVTQVHFRTKRDATENCSSCGRAENSTVDCISSFVSSNLQTKDEFEAKRGRVEIRAKICCGRLIRFNIGIKRSQNSSQPEDGYFDTFADSTDAAGRNDSEVRISFESESDETLIGRGITDGEFHVYEINWDEERVFLEIDKKKVYEGMLEGAAANISNGTLRLDSVPIRKPFYLNVGVEEKRTDDHSRSKRSPEVQPELQVDYIRIFRIPN